jgi:hypothetical protein
MSLSDDVVKLDSPLPNGLAWRQESMGAVQQGWDCHNVVVKVVCVYAELHKVKNRAHHDKKVAGNDWLHSSTKRHSLRLRNDLKDSTQEVVKDFFSKLTSVMYEAGGLVSQI